jgi:outer membrane protein assembly factor BamA
MRPAPLIAAATLACSAPAAAQITVEPLEEMEDKAPATHQEPPASDHKDLVIVPIPQSSPTLGTGVTLVGVLFYNPFKEPSPWVTGVGIMRTSNGSQAIAALHRMSLGGDKVRVVLFGGHAQINVNFYGIGPNAGQRGQSIQLQEKGNLAIAQGQYRIAPNLYAGVRSIFLDLDTGIHRPEPRFPEREIPEREFHTRLVTMGPSFAWDRRDNLFTPRSGELISATWMFSRPGLGSDFDYNKLTIAANVYRSLGKNSVIAAHASLCGTSKGGPFYDVCLYGARGDLRGYEAGRFRDRASWTAQVELRQHLFGRFGVAAFGGLGGIAPDLSSLGSTTFLPAAGIGLRYRASKQTPINFRVDFAVGKDSKAIYLSLGEAF